MVNFIIFSLYEFDDLYIEFRIFNIKFVFRSIMGD